MESVIETVRRPEYTGEDRCWPCTAVNAVLLLVAVGVVALASPALALVAAAIGAGLLWARGYVVPYTPRFAPRLVALLPGDPFHSPAREPGSLADGEPSGEAVLEALVEAGVVEPTEDDLTLSTAFRDRWDREMVALREADTEALAAEALAASPVARDAEAVRVDDREYVVLSDGTNAVSGETWLDRPVAVAEVAAVRALPDDLPDPLRVAAANPLRLFLETCPDCGGPIEETTTAACCGGLTNPREGPDEVLACGECGTRLYTF